MKKTYAMIVVCLAAAAPIASGQVLNEDFKVLSSIISTRLFFGGTVCVSGNTLVAGASGMMFDGAAYVFNATTGTQTSRLEASDSAQLDMFGTSVAVDGNTIVIGTTGRDDRGEDSGAVYVFMSDASSWTQRAKLLATDGAAHDTLGASIAISDNTVVVGSPGHDGIGEDSGAAYVFVRNGTLWTQQAKIFATDEAAFDKFGQSVSISGDTVVVGASDDDDHGSSSGSAYVFTRSGTTWTQQAKLVPDDGTSLDRFGSAVSISGDVTVIGSVGDDDNGSSSGSAYVFTRNGTTWTQQTKLLANDGESNDAFGFSTSISGNMLVVGAIGDNDNGDLSGSTYVFKNNANNWTQVAKLLASDGSRLDRFGRSVSMSAGIIVVGSPFNDEGLISDTGATYLFDIGMALCPGDIANELGTPGSDGFVGFGDFQTMLGLVGPCPGMTPGCDGDIADDFGTLGADGQVSFGDFLALLGLVGPCP